MQDFSDNLKYKQELILFHVPSYLVLAFWKNHTNLQALLRTILKFSCYNESIYRLLTFVSGTDEGGSESSYTAAILSLVL